MKLPIIVMEGNDVALYASVEALTTALEAPDVEAGTYEVFDCEAHPVLLGVAPGPLHRVVVRAVGEDAPVGAITRMLARALEQAFPESRRELSEFGLAELVDFAVKHLGYEG